MIIAIDFDGTIVTHEYPRVGKPLPYAKEVINALVDNGHSCFLYTMRDNKELEEAIKYTLDNDIKLCGYNMSPDQFSSSPKQYAHIYIDDAALGCPLDSKFHSRLCVDWYKVGVYFKSLNLITSEQFKSIFNKKLTFITLNS